MNKFRGLPLSAGSAKQGDTIRAGQNKLALSLIIFGLMLVFNVVIAQAQASPESVTPSPVPVPEGNEPFLVGRADGTQNYVCSPCNQSDPNCPLGVAFKLFTPQATLFNDHGVQLITHFFSPNPVENGLIRATWQNSRDTSRVWASVAKSATVDQDSIAWLLLNVKDTGSQAGPLGDSLTKTTFIRRINTVGGLPPTTDCLSSLDLGHQAFVHYTADYVFYKESPQK
jgi:hypothetical protein